MRQIHLRIPDRHLSTFARFERICKANNTKRVDGLLSLISTFVAEVDKEAGPDSTQQVDAHDPPQDPPQGLPNLRAG